MVEEAVRSVRGVREMDKFIDYDNDIWKRQDNGLWSCFDWVTGGLLFSDITEERAMRIFSWNKED